MNQQISETYALLITSEGKYFFFFALSFLGYLLTILNTNRIKLAFAPIYSIACIVLTLYFSGILNLLEISTNTLYYLGFLLIPLNFITKEKIVRSLQSIFSIELSYFYIVAFLSFYASQGQQLYANDDFSNWGFTSKVMKETKGFVKIGFLLHPEYPPATALFQYFFSIKQTFIESNLLAANAFMTTAASLPILSLIRKKLYKLFALLPLFIAPWVLGANFFTLYVDTLMGLQFGTTLLFILSNKNPTSNTNILLLIPLISLLTLIKGSGFQISLVIITICAILKAKPDCLAIIKRIKHA